MAGRQPRRPPASRILITVAATAAAAIACEDGEPPAIRADDVVFTEGELGALTPEQRERLALLAAFAVLVSGGATDSLVELMSGQERRTRALQLLAGELAVRRQGIDEEDLRRAYMRNPSEELIVRHLVVLAERWRSEDFRSEARARAEAALQRIREGEPLADVAADASDEPGARERGGLLQPGREGDWVPEFWEAASRLEEGEASGIVETRFGFHVLRLEERRTVPLEEVRSEVALRSVGVAAAQRALSQVGDSLQAEVRVDTAALERWRRGELPADSAVVRWPGGGVTARAMDRYAMTLTEADWARLRAAAPPALAAVAAGVARGERLWSLALELGAVPAEDVVDAIRGEWRQRVAGWAAALGIEAGADPRELRVAAMEGLGSDRQNVAIARSEILERGPALRGLVDLEVVETAPAGAR